MFMLRRKKFERSTPVFSYPLPWTPGWRNLLRGRPLGKVYTALILYIVLLYRETRNK